MIALKSKNKRGANKKRATQEKMCNTSINKHKKNKLCTPMFGRQSTTKINNF